MIAASVWMKSSTVATDAGAPKGAHDARVTVCCRPKDFDRNHESTTGCRESPSESRQEGASLTRSTQHPSDVFPPLGPEIDVVDERDRVSLAFGRVAFVTMEPSWRRR